MNILVTSISKKVPLLKAIKKAGKKINAKCQIFGADSQLNVIGKYFVDQFWLMPPLSQLKLETLISYCRSNNIFAIIPTRDAELLIFSEWKDSLKEHDIFVMVSDKEPIKKCIDKLEFYKYSTNKNYPVIPTTENIVDIKAFSYFVVKEKFGAGSENIGTNLNMDEARIHANKLRGPIFQPYIVGKEYSIDIYINNEIKAKGAIVRSRDTVINGESQITTTVKNDMIEKVCCNFAEELGLYGHVVFQVILDDNNNLNILEINCRFGGASPLSIAAGLDSLYWFLLEAKGIGICDSPFVRTSKELKLIRYPNDLVIDMKED
ncbi:ATP-grasp domain-containing protein [Evansella cellulosilytica]|uniref:PylC N-terminal domain-containing protein n=1 Tax=Evansella cellulosilytica (strain ATCC 21833 / DSM 2522 / FERM P-1141 / JCM 9156 / N-4) TaxID=649639 RepID=E6TS80_EVAC2|nr:ATP-grasp domain-containing protein [Evansella cellulosilytica]ADU31849.1 protein of unknown function DUF201 [Evansella cellulosilytica DSM 2522]